MSLDAIGPSSKIAAIALLLAGTCLVKTGATAIGDPDSPPRIVIVRRTGGRSARPVGTGSQLGQKTLQGDAFLYEAHLWGASEGDADQLRAALLTAIRSAMNGPNYTDDGHRVIDTPRTGLGFALSQSFSLYMPLPLVALPAAPIVIPDQGTLQSPGVGVAANAETAIDDVIPVATPTPARGDGLLQSGET